MHRLRIALKPQPQRLDIIIQTQPSGARTVQRQASGFVDNQRLAIFDAALALSVLAAGLGGLPLSIARQEKLAGRPAMASSTLPGFGCGLISSA